MEGNFRNALIIISAIVIAAIFIHGFWTIRKNKNPYKLKAKPEDVEPEVRGFDGSGFDQVGVSKPRIVGENPLADHEMPKEAAPSPQFEADPIPKDLVQQSEHFHNEEPSIGDLAAFDNESSEQNISVSDEVSLSAPSNFDGSAEDDIQITAQAEQIDAPAEKAIYQEPVMQKKPVTAATKTKAKRKEPTKADIKRNQLEINFEEQKSAAEPNSNIEPEVLIISVVMPEGRSISGAALLPTLLTLGLRYGDMNIFHRHEDNAGNGKVTFSLVNMLNPGTFDLDAMETFTTQGISLFMTLPNAGDPFEVFQLMLGAAKQLALEFHGQLLDDKRSVMTMQTEQHYTSKIREFERKNSIALG